MRPASLFLASGLILAIGCGPAPEAPTETNAGAVRSLPETTATETVPPFEPPAGLVEAVTILIPGDDRDDVITVANEDEVGLFTSIASCSLVEGSGWFPLEIVAADGTGSFLRLWSHTYTPAGLGAIEGELIVHHPDRASLAAAVTVFVGDGETSGSFTGTTGDGEAISGKFECLRPLSTSEAEGNADAEVSIRVVDDDHFDERRIRRLGFRTSSTQACPTSSEGTSKRWQIIDAEQPVGGLTTTRLLFNSATNQWSGEFKIAQDVVVVEELAVAEMRNGIVFSGMNADGLSVDGALRC
ncbi:MAG: hypothetical protein CL445_04105 [Acidimicrobiaceae bacterium]|nr:hypothetical protein [Acidimicrobiaceae bacterium]